MLGALRSYPSLHPIGGTDNPLENCRKTANFVVYDYDAYNWAGIVGDYGGNMWFRVGVGGTTGFIMSAADGKFHKGTETTITDEVAPFGHLDGTTLYLTM